MAAQKKSISRKEMLKKPDEFITTSNRIAHWVTDHYQKVIWIGTVVVLVVGAFFGYRAYAAYQEKQGREAYFAALELSEITQKIKKLSSVTADYPRTLGAQKAWISLGHLYYQQKDFTGALNAYRSALSRGKLPPEFQSLINESLAYVLEEKGDLKGAADAFSQLMKGSDPLLKENANLNLARVQVKLGQAKEAKSTYQAFLKSFPDSIYAPLVRDRLAKM
jgi:predicted negative regulator of RcsB-dependent stress response